MPCLTFFNFYEMYLKYELLFIYVDIIAYNNAVK